MASIFLSHNHTDHLFAQRLAAELRLAGVHVWIDEAEIRPGDSLLAKLGSAIRDTEYLGVVLSPEAVQSRWVQVELNAALQMEIRSGHVKVLPVLLRACEMPTFLLDKVYIDLTHADRYFESTAKLIRFLLNLPPPVWLTGKEAAREVKLRGRPPGVLISLSQQGFLQQYIQHSVIGGVRRDWFFSDAKSGRSRIWVADFYDPSQSEVYPFTVRDGEVADFPNATLHDAPPVLDFNFIDSDVAVPTAIQAAQTAKRVPPNLDAFFVTTKLHHWRTATDYVWTVSFLDLALSNATVGVVVNARDGTVLYCDATSS